MKRTTWHGTGKRYPEADASLLNYLRLYLAQDRLAELDRAADYEILALPYDWGLNDQALTGS